MSRLYGFKYDVKSFGKHNYTQYIILSVHNGRLFIDIYKYNTIQHFDITDKVNVFCDKIKALGIETWNGNLYQTSMEWYPPPGYWTLQVSVDNLSVQCSGSDAVPPHWTEFWQAFDDMCS